MITRKLFALLFTIVLLSACADMIPEIAQPAAPTEEAATHTNQTHWSYEEGPQNWEGDCQTSEHQSPINITNTGAKDLPNIAVHYEESGLSLMNNGHTVQANFTAPGEEPRSYIEVIDGEGQTQRYDLAQFHYHAPSEHTVDGKPFAAELHLVHQNAAKENKVVIGILLEEGAENPAYQPFLANLPSEISEKATTISGATINAAGLLPDTQTTYRYAGSLTTPPCTEGISWIVMTTPVQLSAEQLESLENVFEFDNNRPVQPLNERTLIEDTTP